jgi:hypothetical protein
MNAPALTSSHSSEVLKEDRQFQRVAVTLFGRYMLEDRREYPCQIQDMSPGSASLVTTHVGEVGERVIAYIDHIGRLDGKIIRNIDNGFAMSFRATEKKRDKMAAKLTWLANRHELNLAEDRRHERVVPTVKSSKIKLEDGREYEVRIVDLSLSGAALQIDVRPAIGTLLWLGTMRGRVVRHFDDGIAIEFAVLQSTDSLDLYLAGNM